MSGADGQEGVRKHADGAVLALPLRAHRVTDARWLDLFDEVVKEQDRLQVIRLRHLLHPVLQPDHSGGRRIWPHLSRTFAAVEIQELRHYGLALMPQIRQDHKGSRPC